MPNISVDSLLQNIGLKRSRREIGVAFSGGGVRGFAHLGAMRAFDSFGIRPAVISGVSAGAIAGVLYAAGLSPDDIERCFAEYGKFSDYAQWSIPKQGFFKMDRFAQLLESWLPVKNLEDLQIPMYVCAVDFEKGSSKGWCRGEIVPRVIASSSIPVIFPPKRINGIPYVDGGVLRNLPAWAIRQQCEYLIGCNCNPLKKEYKLKSSIIDVALRSYQLIIKSNVLQDLNLCDLVIQSQSLASYKTFDLPHMRKIMHQGYDAACRALEKAGF